MKAGDVKVRIKYAIEENQPLLLVGDRGVGKTSFVHMISHEIGVDFIRSTPGIEDATKPEGLPWIAPDANHAHHVPFAQLYKASKAERTLVWFLDDLGQAPELVQAGYMPIIGEREVNGIKISPHVRFVAATNRKGHTGVRSILEPLKSRFAMILDFEPDLNQWLTDYYYKSEYAVPEVAAYLRARPGKFNEYAPTSEIKNSPSPRNWMFASRLLQQSWCTIEDISAAVGEVAASELWITRKLIQEVPSVEEILAKPDKVYISNDPNILCAIISNLVFACSTKNFPVISIYLKRMFDSQPEFAAALFNDCIAKCEDIFDTCKEAGALARSPLGSLMIGNLDEYLASKKKK